MLANTGPRTNRKARFPVVWSSSMISVPVMSEGMRSGGNWMRENLSSSAWATVAAALSLSFVPPPADPPGARGALGIALAAHGPLGWWLVRAAGTDRFLLVWATGIAARLAVVVACALVIAPKLGLALEPTLFALVGVLMGFVVVEALVVRAGDAGGTERRRTEVR